jgi:glycosyltransferase involved in cell wall biosynthesis
MFLVTAEPTFDQLDRNQLAGASIDVPRGAQSWNVRAVSIEGWAVGRHSAVAGVEVVASKGRLCQLRLEIDRPDVVQHFQGAAETSQCGFRGEFDIAGIPDATLEVRAVLTSGESAHIGSLHLRRFWRAGISPAEQNVASVVIVCFNQAHFLPDAVESALDQTHPKTEVIVVDDGSSDNTAEIVARYPNVRHVHQPNQGLAAARNTGLSRSNGEFILFLDADDRLRPKAIETAVERLRTQPDCAFVWGEYRDIGVDGNVLGEWKRPTIERDHYLVLLRSNYITCPASVVYRRSVFNVVDGFRAEFNPCEDYELYLRISRSYPVCSHGDVVADYRRYGTGMSTDPGKMLESALLVLDTQRPFIGRDGPRARAFSEGQRHWRTRYGAPLADLIRKNLLRHGTRRQALKQLGVLLRKAPEQLVRVVRP